MWPLELKGHHSWSHPIHESVLHSQSQSRDDGSLDASTRLEMDDSTTWPLDRVPLRGTFPEIWCTKRFPCSSPGTKTSNCLFSAKFLVASLQTNGVVSPEYGAFPSKYAVVPSKRWCFPQTMVFWSCFSKPSLGVFSPKKGGWSQKLSLGAPAAPHRSASGWSQQHFLPPSNGYIFVCHIFAAHLQTIFCFFLKKKETVPKATESLKQQSLCDLFGKGIVAVLPECLKKSVKQHGSQLSDNKSPLLHMLEKPSMSPKGCVALSLDDRVLYMSPCALAAICNKGTSVLGNCLTTWREWICNEHFWRCWKFEHLYWINFEDIALLCFICQIEFGDLWEFWSSKFTSKSKNWSQAASIKESRAAIFTKISTAFRCFPAVRYLVSSVSAISGCKIWQQKSWWYMEHWKIVCWVRWCSKSSMIRNVDFHVCLVVTMMYSWTAGYWKHTKFIISCQ